MDQTEGCYSTLYNGKNSPDSAHKEWRGAVYETWPARPETWQDKGQCGCQTFLFDHSYNLGRRPLYSLLVSCFVKAAGVWQFKKPAVTHTCQAKCLRLSGLDNSDLIWSIVSYFCFLRPIHHTWVINCNLSLLSLQQRLWDIGVCCNTSL